MAKQHMKVTKKDIQFGLKPTISGSHQDTAIKKVGGALPLQKVKENGLM